MARKRKKPSKAVRLVKSVAKRRKKKANLKPRKNAVLVGNPPLGIDIWEMVVPGLGAYAGTRLAGRIGYRLARKKSAAVAKFAGPVTSVIVAAIGWYLVHKVKKFSKYHTPVVVGASIAALQGLLQTFLPQYGWILNDYHLDDATPEAMARAQLLPPEPGEIPGGEAPEALPEPSSDDLDLDALLNDGESIDDLYGGSFSGGYAN